MKKGLILTVIIAMFGWAIYSFVAKDDGNATESAQDDIGVIGLEKGNFAPDFELESIDGDPIKLSDLRGQPVFVNFWATWCPPCRAEMPDMQKIHEEYDDVTILAVNEVDTESSPRNVEKFIEEFGITFPIPSDSGLNVGTRYRATSLPTTYLINPDGTIHNVAVGPLTYEMMVQEIKAMQKNK